MAGDRGRTFSDRIQFGMPLPTFDQLLRPLLEIAARQDLTRRYAEPTMSDMAALSAEERNKKTASGATLIGLRVSWAMTFLTKAGFIEKVASRTYRATDAGREFLLSHPERIALKDLEALPGWKEAWKSSRRKGDTPAVPDLSPAATPIETIDSAVSQLHADVRGRLLDSILNQGPAFFERLVLDVLVRMGYGGSAEEAAEHLGRSGDEGIDGRINQDALGLDQILVQAKRYAPENVVSRQAIQAFIGSLAGQGVSKGIFITTSSFSTSAEEFVLRGSQTKIVLIDGPRLLDLMLDHKIGVRVERTVEVLDIDQNYFEEAD